jgi:hypothetical protein
MQHIKETQYHVVTAVSDANVLFLTQQNSGDLRTVRTDPCTCDDGEKKYTAHKKLS